MKKSFFISVVIVLLATMDSCKNNAASQVIDVDGNVYDTVHIGTQIWMKQNLKTAHYRNGAAVREIEDSSSWASIYSRSPLTSPYIAAWCYYNGDSANNAVYGKLYNWYAVIDTEGLCPAGFHVPSDAEWTQLSDYFGGHTSAGGRLKAITLWQAPNTNADNSSGFTALPGGYRSYRYGFYFIGSESYFWSSTIYDRDGFDGWSRSLDYDSPLFRRGDLNKVEGLSVRCVGN